MRQNQTRRAQHDRLGDSGLLRVELDRHAFARLLSPARRLLSIPPRTTATNGLRALGQPFADDCSRLNASVDLSVRVREKQASEDTLADGRAFLGWDYDCPCRNGSGARRDWWSSIIATLKPCRLTSTSPARMCA
jgi:hypothetical protein